MLHRTFVALALLLGLLAGFGTEAAFAKGPCETIIKACKAAGFQANGGSAGNGVNADCVSPILKGQGGKANLPTIGQDVIEQCKQKRSSSKVAKAVVPPEGSPAAGAMPVAPLAMPAGKPLPPNIVFVLVDDFSFDLMSKDQGILEKSMPNLAQMMKDGASFSNYFVTDSLCCPSRTSIFTGLMPHNSKVFTNVPPNGGYGAFMAAGDEEKTFAMTLHAASYSTAMMGKYLNGYHADANGVAKGWSEWAVADNGYPNFNYVLNHSGKLITSPLHLTDEISQLGQDYIKASAAGPFFLEVATFSPHSPYVPPARYATAFADLNYPQTPAYGARPDDAAPDWLHQIKPLDQTTEDTMAEQWRNRVRSDKGIDDMIGALRKTLVDQGVADRTYFIFTSDNGYHMGEYSLRSGKMTPFDTDIHVPLVVVGPGIAAGTTIDKTAMNIDFYPTFAEWSGSPANPDVDGHSFAGLLQGKESDAWRSIALVEHKHDDGKTSTDPDKPAKQSGNPPDYAALRMPGALYVEYEDGSGLIGYYDMTNDPYQLHNIAGTLSPEKRKALHEALLANTACKGHDQCWAAQSMTP